MKSSSSNRLQSHINGNFCEIVPEKLWHSCQKPPFLITKGLSYWYTRWWLMTDPLTLRSMVPSLWYVSYSSVIFILEIWKVYCVKMDACSHGPRQMWLTAAWVTSKTTTTHPSAGWKGQRPSRQNTPLQNRGQTSHFLSFFQNRIQLIMLPSLKGLSYSWLKSLRSGITCFNVWVIKSMKLFQPSWMISVSFAKK